jgi:acyl dehydratase
LTIIVGEKSFIHADTKEMHAKVTTFLVARDMGGFGFKGSVKPLISETRPKREPDCVVEEPFPPHVAILYRLTGDLNPLHIDPVVAKSVGFKAPIAHGLSFYGYTCRVVFEKYGGGNSQNIKSAACRFTASVYPGQTLVVEMWKIPNENKVYFETKTKDAGTTVIKGVMEFTGDAKL